MTLLTVVKDVCMANGVNPPSSMFGTSTQPRTQAELLSLANEMAQRIAYDVREWRALKSIQTFTSADGTADRYALPADFKRMLLTAQVYPSASTKTPLKFVPDANEWLLRRINNWQDGWGEWTIIEFAGRAKRYVCLPQQELHQVVRRRLRRPVYQRR
jgi:hypothetical protein